MAAERVLTVLLGGAEIGLVRLDQAGRMAFTYDAEWQALSQATAVSLSMPLLVTRHPKAAIEPFIWGLLPDNEQVLERLGRQFQVSPRNAFALIGHVGEDCAGAVQFIRPERRAALRGGGGSVRWLDDAEVALRLRELRTVPGAWRRPEDEGQFSLAGAQPKTALLFQDGRWGIPSGRTPTTHILKAPTGEFDGQAENEHFCLTLAGAVGLPVADSQVTKFEGETAIVVQRFDRFATSAMAEAAAEEAAAHAAAAAADQSNQARFAVRVMEAAARAASLADLAERQPILRLHQEDLCQALGLPPTKKYQNEGGPSPETAIDLLRTHSGRAAEDVATFTDALIFNWVIAGPDAHAKNYALLHGARGRVRLAPLYDVASALPYPQVDLRRLTLAMRIGDAYRMEEIGPSNWTRFARRNRMRARDVADRVVALANKIATEAPVVLARLTAAGLRHPILDRLAALVHERAVSCARLMEGGAMTEGPSTV